MIQHGHRFRLCYFACCAVLAPVPARADIVILGSDVPGLASGQVLKDADQIEVPDGGNVRFMTPSGRAELLTGPVVRKVSELSGEKGAADAGLWNEVTSRLGEAVDSASRKKKATRSISTPGPAVMASPYTFSWTDIPLSSEGDICVERGAGLRIVRAPFETAERATLIDLQSGGRRAEIAFVAGAKTVPWPSEVTPRVGNFALQTEATGARSFRLRLIAPLPNAQDALRVLHGQRCELQRNALLDAMKDPKFQLSALAE